MRAVSHFLNVFVVEDATLYVSIDFRVASVTHSECSNVVVDAELQSCSFWARRNDVRGIGSSLVRHGI